MYVPRGRFGKGDSVPAHFTPSPYQTRNRTSRQLLLPSSRGCASCYILIDLRPLGQRYVLGGRQTAPCDCGAQNGCLWPKVRGQASVHSHREARQERKKEKEIVMRAPAARVRQEAASLAVGRGAMANERAGRRRPAAPPSRHTSYPQWETGALQGADTRRSGPPRHTQIQAESTEKRHPLGHAL